MLEFVVDRIRGTRYYHLADAINSLSCGIVSTGMRVFFGFLGSTCTSGCSLHAAPVRLPASIGHLGLRLRLLRFLLLLAAPPRPHGGSVLGHPLVHHQSEEFNLTTALRQPGTGSFTNWIFYVPMALCGVPVSRLPAVGVAQLFYQFWPHTRHIGRLGFLDRWIQTPSNHRVHHAQNDIYLDQNYVGVFLIWDRLFGTFQEELDEEP